LLESQAGLTNIDLVVKGTINGQRHGLLYQPGSANYLVDTVGIGTLTRAQLRTNILGGDTLTLTGVPPGSGRRMGIDRDLDGVFDADVPPPALQITKSGASPVLAWPYSAAGYVLESSPSLSSATWTSVTNPIAIVNGQNVTTNPPTTAARFYRLHFQ
jgi:hypothetical protein